MFTSIVDFKSTYEEEIEGTMKILSALSDVSLSQTVTDGHRTLGRVAWHIAATIPEMSKLIGLDVKGPDEKAPVPKTAAEIKAAYKKASDSLMEQVVSNWSNDTLQVEDDMYGQTWKRGKSLAVIISHEVHHRGQMTVLMRQAGLIVPGVYGPAMEEWEQYGAPPPAI
ncbi:MAG: hypothetical protein GF315_07400 [candidate division Zixibacteria bacterium]|nr:hypothetical protein [candidate division Zixibacteria bacterium]